jgi:hypothetical protein
MVFYIEQDCTTIHFVQSDEKAMCGLYSPNWRLPQEPYDPKFVCDTCAAEMVVWQLAGLPKLPRYVWFNHESGSLIHESMG